MTFPVSIDSWQHWHLSISTLTRWNVYLGKANVLSQLVEYTFLEGRWFPKLKVISHASYLTLPYRLRAVVNLGTSRSICPEKSVDTCVWNCWSWQSSMARLLLAIGLLLTPWVSVLQILPKLQITVQLYAFFAIIHEK